MAAASTHPRNIEALSPRDRARGALLGLAAGDAVGTTVEFESPGSFEPLTDMVGGGPFHLKPGQWTDDTSLALCLAESLLDRGGHDGADQLRRYLQWWRQGYLSSTGTCFDIGVATSRHLSRFEHTGEVEDAIVDHDAASNGSLMRLAPVAIRWASQPAALLEVAAAASRTTHPARRPVDACRVLATMTAALIRGEDAQAVFAPDFWPDDSLHPEVEAVTRGSWRGKSASEVRGSGFCVAALEAAIWAVAGADDFRDAILRAANLGDDADTTAAIAGQLAGARFGESGIPRGWLDKLALRHRIASLADGLHAASNGEVMPWAFDEQLHAWWMQPGQVLAGEYPGKKDAKEALEHLGMLADCGVRTIVDLTRWDDHLEPYADAWERIGRERGLHLRRLHHPIRDVSVIDQAGYQAIVHDIEQQLDAGRVVYVHCWGGVGRTGTVVGAWLRNRGHSFHAALNAIRDARSGTRKGSRRSPETGEQERAIRDFVPWREAVAGGRDVRVALRRTAAMRGSEVAESNREGA